MKQTNNAIKFLMAQYRAIFKNAYFKGMASAVLLTAGLAVAGGAQAATNIDETNWGNLTAVDGVTTVNGENVSDGTSGNYTDFDFNTSGTGITTDVEQYIKITGQSGSNVVSSSGAEVKVTGTNTTIELNGDSASDAVLAIKASGANAATLSIRDLKVGVGKLTIGEGTATKAATLEALNTIDLLGGTDSKIIFSGSGAANAVLQGHLTSSATDTTKLTTLDFTGNGTLKTYGTDVKANISVASGASAANTALLSIEDVDTTNDVDEGFLSIKTGTISIEGSSTANQGGVFQINKGTLELGKDVKVTASGAETSGAATLQVSGAAATDATLRIYADTVKNFLAGDANSSVAAGALSVDKGTVELLDTTEIDLSTDLGADVFATSATAGKIHVGTGSIIKGNKLAVSAALSNATNANIEATTLTLGSETYDSTAGTGFGFASATTQSLNLEQSGSGAFVLNDAINLKATQEVDNIYNPSDSGDKITIAAEGGNIANHDLKLNGQNKALTIAAGHYTGNVDVELSSGSLVVGLGSSAATTNKVNGIDARLTFTAGTTLKFDNTKANSITVEGNGQTTDNWFGTTKHTGTSTLDLRQATIEFASDGVANPGSNYNKLTTFNVNEGGELLVTEDQMNYLLNNIHDARDTSTISGAAIVLSGSATGDGAVIVDGDLEVAVDTLKSGTGTANDTVYFNGGGILQADSLTITDAPADADRLTYFTAHGNDICSGLIYDYTYAINK